MSVKFIESPFILSKVLNPIINFGSEGRIVMYVGLILMADNKNFKIRPRSINFDLISHFNRRFHSHSVSLTSLNVRVLHKTKKTETNELQHQEICSFYLLIAVSKLAFKPKLSLTKVESVISVIRQF